MMNKAPDEFDRKWRNKLIFSWYEGISVEFNKILIQLHGQPVDIVASGYLLRLTYREWKIEDTHIYYDGSNCFWQFGPLIFGRYGCHVCKKCLGDK